MTVRFHWRDHADGGCSIGCPACDAEVEERKAQEGLDLRALSLTPPWPTAILDLCKTIENRTRLPSPKFRGRIALHASQLRSKREFHEAVEFIRGALETTPDDARLRGIAKRHLLAGSVRLAAGREWSDWEPGVRIVQGAIVGVADVVDSTPFVDSDSGAHRALTAAERRWWMGGPAYRIANVNRLPEPIPSKGALGLWRVHPAVAREIHRQMVGVWSDRP